MKRKAQNRAAQRAFRERKERYVKELESKIKQIQDTHLASTTQLVRENHQLRSIIYRLETENYALKGTPMQPYQYQATLSQQHLPPPQQHEQRHNSGTYPSIAPLLPQQQPLLPAYLSASSPVSSTLHNSTINHIMMLASGPLQQYPMSPVISMTNSTLSSPTLSKKIPLPISKKVASKRNNTATPPPNNQPLEYTFSISTPASLRPSGGAVTSSKHTRSQPIELVQLHPPGGKVTEKSNDLILSPKALTSEVKVTTQRADDESSIVSDKTSSTVNTQQQRKNMQQLELDMLDCHIDTEGQLFCEKLYNEVCNDAFNRLLSEPLFDQMGKLNLSISTYPVPIVTGHHMSLANSGDESSDDEEKSVQEIVEPISPSPPLTEKRLLTCPEIWFLLNQHEKVHIFTTDQLCQAVKELAKCADSGPVLEEKDLYQIMCNMDQGFI